MATRLTTDTSLNKLMNLDDNSYLRNRLKYHAASRIGIQTGQALGQAMNLDGHNVQSSQVWTSPATAFIRQSTEAMRTTTDGIASNEQLVANFIATGTEEKDLANGKVYTNANYPAVKLYEQCEMSAVVGSNGSGTKYEAYELKDGNVRVMDWIAPTSVKDNGLPVPGYTARIEVFKGNKWTDLQDCADVEGNWALAQNNWEFVYMSGLCTFNPEATPAEWEYSKLRITAFAYCGTYLSDTLANSTIAIKPFEFDASQMTPDNGVPANLSIVIPGMVFNVFRKDIGISYGNIEYLSGANAGKTLFTIEDYAGEGIVTEGENPTVFTAYSFVLTDGGLVPILPKGTIESSSSSDSSDYSDSPEEP